MGQGFLLVALGCWSLQAQPPDLILINGQVFTGAPNQPMIEALAITGRRISATGASDSISHLAGAATQVIDLQGRLVIPGFNDGHIHFIPEFVGKKLDFESNDPGCEEVLRAIKAAVARAKSQEVITRIRSLCIIQSGLQPRTTGRDCAIQSRTPSNVHSSRSHS